MTKASFLPGYFIIVLALLVGLSVGAPRAAAQNPPLPLCLPDKAWRPLERRWDPGLQARLEGALKQNALWRCLLDEGKMAVGLVDLSNPQAPRFAKVNGYTMLYAASLPKLAVLLAAFKGFDDGSLKETPELQRDLVEMVRRSDNPATTQVINRIGMKRIEQVVRAPAFQFYDPKQGGGIWLGSDYSGNGVVNPEPLTGLYHTANVTQLCRFYYLLAYGRLINPERSRQILKILAFPDLHDKFVSALEPTTPLNCVYRKSGEYRLWRSDSVLVWGESGRRYILAAMLEHEQAEKILQELVPVVERLLKPGGSPPAVRPAKPPRS